MARPHLTSRRDPPSHAESGFNPTIPPFSPISLNPLPRRYAPTCCRNIAANLGRSPSRGRSSLRERFHALGQDLATVDDDGLPGNIGSFLRGEKQCCVADVLDGSELLQRD